MRSVAQIENGGFWWRFGSPTGRRNCLAGRCPFGVGGQGGNHDNPYRLPRRRRSGQGWPCRGKSAGKPLAATGWFAAGYFVAWIGFSLAATFVQWGFERTALLDSRMASASNALAGMVLIAAGVYQWTPLKDVCLVQCQTPFQFLMRHGGFRSDVPGCLLLGLRHGAYCVGCCWVLMALLFVGGVMNVLWIALLALLVLLEKLTPYGRSVARVAGIACVAAGAWLLLS